jgi:antitoxin component of MazEF toxin-antitoxin module
MASNLFVGRMVKNGGSVCVNLPQEVRAQLRLLPGDLLLMRLLGPVLIMRRAEARMVIDQEQIPTDAIPPSKVGATK